MTIDELGAATKLKRNVGALIRGEVVRPSPDQVKALTSHLPVTANQILEASGYDVTVTPKHEVPQALAEAWAELDQHGRRLVLGLAQQIATALREARERAS